MNVSELIPHGNRDASPQLFIETHQIPTYFLDFERQLTFPNLLSLLQEAAWKHAERHHFGYGDLSRQGVFWVLSKIRVIMHRAPQGTETLRIETWGKEPELLTAFRDYEGFDGQGRRCFSATSSWHILSVATNRPQALDAFRKGFPVAVGRHAIEEKPGKISAPPQPQTTPPAAVLPSDIDMQKHVNNTRFVQWVLDRFPFDYLQEHRLREIEVNFLQQAKIGDYYHVATGAVSATECISSVVRENDGKELARIRTQWEVKKN
jgi:acyl-ACP thioesterase